MARDDGPNVLAVFGLGNPGRRYRGTRHNVGFEVLDRLAKTLGVSVARRRFSAKIGEARTDGGKLLLVKPQTYVNESGRSVRSVVAWHRLAPEDVLVVCDHLDLECGKLRIRRKGSGGGHNGIESIAAALGSTAFARLRIGIGRPEPEDAVDYVLGRFEPEEREAVARAIDTAAEAVRCWAAEGIEPCMNRFN